MPWRERDKGKKNFGTRPTVASASAVTEQSQFCWFLLGDIAVLDRRAMHPVIRAKAMSPDDWENYNFNIPFPPSSLLRIFHYTSLWLLTVRYKWIFLLSFMRVLLFGLGWVCTRGSNLCKVKKGKATYKWGKK